MTFFLTTAYEARFGLASACSGVAVGAVGKSPTFLLVLPSGRSMSSPGVVSPDSRGRDAFVVVQCEVGVETFLGLDAEVLGRARENDDELVPDVRRLGCDCGEVRRLAGLHVAEDQPSTGEVRCTWVGEQRHDPSRRGVDGLLDRRAFAEAVAEPDLDRRPPWRFVRVWAGPGYQQSARAAER